MRRVLAGVLLCVGVTRPVHAGPLESSERRNDVFGTAVAIDGDRLAVGAPGVDDDGFNAGLIYVFEREGGEWRRDAAVRPDEPIGLSYFGASVALRGDVLVVGAPFDWEESVHDRRGAGYVFVRSSGAWEQQLVVRTGDDADDLGERVALGRERAAFAAPTRRLGAELVPGVVIVVGRDGEAWREEARIERPDVEGFGLALAMDDDRLVVTGYEPGPNPDFPDYTLYPYLREGDAWVAGEPLPLDWSGYGIRLEGETLLAAQGDGQLQFYTASGTTWAPAQTIEPEGDTYLGPGGPALSGGRAAVAVMPDAADGMYEVQMLDLVDGAWTRTARVVSPLPRSSSFGEAIALSAGWLAVGAPEAGAFEEERSGRAVVFAASQWTLEGVVEGGDVEAGCGCRGGAGGPLPGLVWLLSIRRRRR